MNSPKLIEKFFPCKQCGASLRYSIKTGSLKCPYCGFENRIEDLDEEIREYDFNEALNAIERVKFKELKEHEVKCPSCSAVFRFEENVYAGVCPYCGIFVVEDITKLRPITAQSLIPFEVKKDKAFNIFKEWIKSLWFAPSKLKSASFEANFNGIFLPYWTYDSYTVSKYRGMRGDIYYEDAYVTVYREGRAYQELKRVQKIRWSSSYGTVKRHFDDVLVGASKRLSRQIIDALRPWPLQKLVPYNERYITGFESEVYQVNLDDGFDVAKYYMLQTIREDIRYDIGGDLQKITAVHTDYYDKTFKHILLPVWSASFNYGGKIYRFAINGVTGKIKGERPFSKIKIFFTVLFVLLCLALLFYISESDIDFDFLIKRLYDLPPL